MPDIPTQSTAGTWSVPECPFTITYVPEVMDNMRLAVMDAFFSLPRGGAEIGGVLLGTHAQSRVNILDSVPIECEHATGPSFVLSLRDESKLQEVLSEVKRRRDGLQVVGWYHSHTRSEIFLSNIDLELHQRFFPEVWQIALVLKPHTFQPMRGGFFFRNAGGSMRSDASCREFAIQPMPMRPVPAGAPAADGAATAPQREAEAPRSAPASVAIPVSNEEPVAEPASMEVLPLALDTPKFAQVASQQRSGLWWKVILALSVGLLVGIVYQTRDLWLPKVLPAPRVSKAASLDLTALDTGGQLLIRWDPSSAAVQQALSGELSITDGTTMAKRISLDPDHLRSGTFTYGRESDRIDVLMVVTQANGNVLRAGTAFAGKQPEKPVPTPDDQTPKLKADLAAQREQVRRVQAALDDESSQSIKLKHDLATQMDRNKKLEKSLSDATEHIKRLEDEQKEQQRKRLGAQDPGKQ